MRGLESSWIVMTTPYRLRKTMNFWGLHLEVGNQQLLLKSTNVRLSGLPDKKLYPTVSAVYGNTEVSMVYLGPPLDG